jgi:hypothetical protein
MGSRFFLIVFLLTVITAKSIAQNTDKILTAKYLTLKSATWQWVVSPVQRKKPTPSRPYKTYKVEFLVKKGCRIANASADIGNKKLKGRIIYNNNTQDSFEVKKNCRVSFQFIYLPGGDNKVQNITENKAIEANYQDESITLWFYLNGHLTSYKAQASEKKRGENEPLLQ